jgi:hypothetical protein
MAVAPDATGTKLVGGSSAVTSLDYTGITVGAGLSNGALVAVIFWGVTTAPTGISAKWDNTGTPQTMTQIGSTVTFAGTGGTTTGAVFALRNPTAGNKTLHFAWTGTGNFPTACAISFTGVDQTSDGAAFKNFASNTGNLASNASLSTTVTSATGDLVFGAFGETGTLNATPMNGTVIYSDVTSNGADTAANRQAGAASVTVTGTNGNGGGAGSIVFGFDLAAAAAATLVTGWQNLDSRPYLPKPFIAQPPIAFVSNFQSTSTIAGNAWYEPFDIPVYGKPLRDFVAPAFTEPVAVTVGIAGNAWFEPFDQPIYGKKLRDFVPPAFTEPAAVTVGISGMAWFEPLDIPVYGKPLRDFVAPAFTEPTAVTVGVAGNAWFEPFDIPVYGKPLRDHVPPAFTSQFTIAGISGVAWFVREDVYKAKPRPVDDPPSRALQFTNQTVSISGNAWFEPWPELYRRRAPIDVPPPVPFQPPVITWAFEVSDTIFILDRPNDPPPAYTFPVPPPPVLISGMAWFVREDSYKKKYIPFDQQPLPQLEPARQQWAFEVSDTIFLPDPPDSNPPAMITLEPPAQQWAFEVSDTIFLPDPPPNTAPCWEPQFVFQQTVGISGMAWFVREDSYKFKVIPMDQPPKLTPQPVYQIWSTISSDEVALPDPLLTVAPAWDAQFVFQQTVGISGMAWFTPPDFAKTRIVNYTPPPGWDPQFVFQVEVPNDRIVKFIGNVGHFMIR